MNTRYHRIHRRTQRGAALVIGLIMLLVLTILAVSSMNTATLELRMAGNFQSSTDAFHAAEAAISTALPLGKDLNPDSLPAAASAAISGSSGGANYTYQFQHVSSTDETIAPEGGFEFGKFTAYHYDVLATGTAARNSRAVNVQSFYIIAPKGGS